MLILYNKCGTGKRATEKRKRREGFFFEHVGSEEDKTKEEGERGRNGIIAIRNRI